MLAPLVAAFGDRPSGSIFALHVVLGAGTVLLTFWAARRWELAPGRALVAAAIVAFDPVLLVQTRSVMTETLAAFLVAGTLGLLAGPHRVRSSVLGGFGFGMATLCRPSLLPAAVLSALGDLVLGPGLPRQRAGRAVLLLLATLATLAPWAARNARVFGEPVWTTTHGGYTLALANNPAYYADVLDGPPGAVWQGPGQDAWFAWVARRIRRLPEPEGDRVLRDEAIRVMVRRPRDFTRASLARLGRFWGVAPTRGLYSTTVRAATALWTIPLWLTLGLGLVSRDLWRWPRLAAPACLFALTAVHAFYWTDLRMRAPIVPAVALIVAGGRWTWLLSRGGGDCGR